MIEQLKFTLGEILSVEVFTKAYKYLKNSLVIIFVLIIIVEK